MTEPLAMLADGATVGLAVATVGATLLRKSATFRAWCLGLGLRSVLVSVRARVYQEQELRELLAALGLRAGGARTWRLFAILQRGRLRRRLMAPALALLQGDALTPGDAVAVLVRRPTRDVSQVAELADVLRRLYGTSTRGNHDSLIARLLYPDEHGTVIAFHKALGISLGPFARSRVIPSDRASSDPADPTTFAGFATALSGAPVLIDAAGIRSRHADGVLVWHQRTFRDIREDNETLSSYDARHGAGFCDAWAADRQMPGDFDRRVIDLRGVAMTESSALGRVSFALSTWESCYASTESGSGARGCKKVPSDPFLHEDHDPLFRLTDGQRWQAHDGRITLLTSYVGVLTTDDTLVLVHRSTAVRNGSDVWSASAGGIVDPDEPGDSGDVSRDGFTDPLAAARRESMEEIGLDLPEDAVRPVAVFLANVKENSSDPAGPGQLVGVVLSLARVEHDLDQLRTRGRSRSDASKGRFEWESFIECPATDVAKMAQWARRNAARLDQHGLLSVLYTAMTLFGPEPTRAAFLQAFRTGPWWCGSAAGPAGHRVCRDPGALIGADTGDLLAAVAPRWRQAWVGLREAAGPAPGA